MLSVQKQGGLRSLVGWVKGRLIELFTFLGVFDIVTEFQVQMLATRLCTKYYYWTTTELDYAFIRIMEGKYGKLYQYKHEYEDKSTATTINPQDLMIALDSYEKELLLERGKVEAERRKEEERLKAIEDAKKPHGIEAWINYCKSKGLDPDTHTLPSVSLHDVNKELNIQNRGRMTELR